MDFLISAMISSDGWFLISDKISFLVFIFDDFLLFGMYSGCDKLSLQILFVYFLALPSLLHLLIFNCFFILV